MSTYLLPGSATGILLAPFCKCPIHTSNRCMIIIADCIWRKCTGVWHSTVTEMCAHCIYNSHSNTKPRRSVPVQVNHFKLLLICTTFSENRTELRISIKYLNEFYFFHFVIWSEAMTNEALAHFKHRCNASHNKWIIKMRCLSLWKKK